MLKLLQVCNKAPYPANDGSSIAIYNMARGLMENDVQVYLLTINTRKHFKPDHGVDQTFARGTHYRSVFRNTDTSLSGALLNLFSGSSYFVSRFYFAEFERVLIETLRQHQFDIIQLEGVFMGTYLPVIRKYSKAKVVLRAHNIEHFIWERHSANEKNPLRRAYLRLQNSRLRRFELDIFNQVDAVVTITDADKNALPGLGVKTPCFTCITGVDVNEYQKKPALPEKDKTVFYFASMDWIPNQEAVEWFLDNCWDKILKQVPDARFVIAGRGMPAHLKNSGRSNVLSVENITDGKAFYTQHQLMVVPLLSGSGLRIKIIEGMAYGKAIVSTSVGCEGIPCTDKTNIMIADLPGDFSKSVVTLLTNSSARRSMQEQATALAYAHFDNREVLERLVNFYKQLVHVSAGVGHTL